MRSPRLAALELRRFGRGKLPRAALVALLVLPLLYGALYLWSFWDPYGRLDRVPVALVNDDKGATASGKRVTAGDDIVAGLRDSKSFDWHEVSAAEARRGVEDGTYYLSLTVPADFSARIASSAGDSPQTGALQVRTNDANNYIVGQISRTVFNEVRSAASTKASRSFLDRIFVSFADIHGQTVKAADGADTLAGGIGKAEKGSKDLANGLTDARTGSAKLAKGIRKLDTGAGTLEDGSRQVADGTQALADRVDGVYGKVGPYLAQNEKTIGDTARLVADSAQTVRDNLGVLVKTAPAAAKTAHAAAETLDQVYAARCSADLLTDPVCPDLKKARDAADDVAAVADDLNALIADQNGDLKTLDANLGTLQTQARALADRAPHLAEDVADAVKKIDRLNEGAARVAAGAAKLHTGLGTAVTGATGLDSGLGRLESGAYDLDGGMYKLADGSNTLAGGLHDGAAKIPDYDKQDRDERTGVMADPVQLASHDLHKAPNYGTGFAPYFIPLSLWVGAMVAYMLIQPLNRRALAAGSAAWRIALAGWLPVVAVGVLQTAALMAVLHWAIGLEMVRAAGTVGFLFLVAACFAAIVQWLNARFGAAGRILVLALLMLQLTSAGGTYPVQTSPGFFNAIHPFLPMSYVVSAL
ncbi:YhgE/Pip family protein, partial [Streptomyces sp. NPDC002172]